jgi:hypothetical protein
MKDKSTPDDAKMRSILACGELGEPVESGLSAL